MAVHGRWENATGVCCAAAAGAAFQWTCAPRPRSAAGAAVASVAASWDFALPGHCDPMVFVFAPEAQVIILLEGIDA